MIIVDKDRYDKGIRYRVVEDTGSIFYFDKHLTEDRQEKYINRGRTVDWVVAE